MIYFKRFLFGILTISSILFGVIGTILTLLSYPIVGLLYYVITGNDPLDDEDNAFFCWIYAIKFIDWSQSKLFENDKR